MDSGPSSAKDHIPVSLLQEVCIYKLTYDGTPAPALPDGWLPAYAARLLETAFWLRAECQECCFVGL